MDKLLDKLHEIKKSLKPGTVAGGRDMPTIKTPFDNGPKVKATSGVQKLKGIGPGSKVNPVKSAEQTQNKDIKDMKMKEAQAALKIKPLDLKKEEKKLKDMSPNEQYEKHKANYNRALKFYDGNHDHPGMKYYSDRLDDAKKKIDASLSKSNLTFNAHGQWSLD